MATYDAAVIGAGHNGLTCACYLARAGMRVIVLEMADRIGGAVHTAETIPERPGYRFDTCSVVHNLVRMAGVLEELRLEEVGLEYVETDPFSTSFFPGGEHVRFYRSVDRTCQEIARFSERDAEGYREFVRLAEPVMEMTLGRLRASGDDAGPARTGGSGALSALRALRRSSPRWLASALLGPDGPLLEALFETEQARMGVAPLAAHGTLGPHTPGTAFFAFFQAAYHRYGTPSAIDDRLAPAGEHTAYVACASYPARFADGSTWAARGEREAHRLLDAVEARAPGFRASVTGLAWRHAADWEREIGLLGGHPMHLDITMDQVGLFRPLPELGDHRTPVEGLYLSGAGTAPGGGVSGAPGRAAARAALNDAG